MRVKLADLQAQYQSLEKELDATLKSVLAEQSFILGPRVESFEAEIANYIGVRHALGVSSGSDALFLALKALGLGAGDEVITTPFSFFASAGSIVRAGATPRFADIDPETLNLDPRAANAAIGPRTKALLVVHLYGAPVDIDAFESLCKRHGLALIEDAAQAFGSEYRARKVGSFGTVACLSFHPSKVLGAYGDAGMVLTSDSQLAERVRALRVHGATGKHRHVLSGGGNFRLDALQAAVLSTKLPHVERWIAERERHAQAYDAQLAGIETLGLPRRSAIARDNHALYTVRVRDGRRDPLAEALSRAGVETALHYPAPLHLQPALEGLGLKAGAFPHAESAAAQVLQLPLYAELSLEAREYVGESVRSWFSR